MSYVLKDDNRGNEKEFDDEDEAKEKRNDLISLGAKPEDLEIVEVESDGGGKAETQAMPVDDDMSLADTPGDDVKETEVVNSPEQLAEDPIGWLEGINNDFVNTIKGTPAISKQGFRFIQSQFGITTESEVVEVLDDPTGVLVWAKAELPDGQSAEAHGEGYLTERDVDDNEFCRYADTRAKNRAISDLTSAGALAVSELSKEQ